jgi:hypothetical protein
MQTASATLFPIHSGFKLPIFNENLVINDVTPVLSTQKRGVRMPKPIRLINENNENCCQKDLILESGYVQYRFNRKLFTTARVNEMAWAINFGHFKKIVSKFKIPKSIIVPMVPTIANFKNRFFDGEDDFTKITLDSENIRSYF